MTHSCQLRDNIREWADRLPLPPAPRKTLGWLINQADVDCQVVTTLQQVAALDGIKEGSALSRLRDLQRRELLILNPISTARVKRRYLVEIRWPLSAAETRRILQRHQFEEAGRRMVQQAPARRRMWDARDDKLRRGMLDIEDLWT